MASLENLGQRYRLVLVKCKSTLSSVDISLDNGGSWNTYDIPDLMATGLYFTADECQGNILNVRIRGLVTSIDDLQAEVVSLLNESITEVKLAVNPIVSIIPASLSKENFGENKFTVKCTNDTEFPLTTRNGHGINSIDVEEVTCERKTVDKDGDPITVPTTGVKLTITTSDGQPPKIFTIMDGANGINGIDGVDGRNGADGSITVPVGKPSKVVDGSIWLNL